MQRNLNMIFLVVVLSGLSAFAATADEPSAKCVQSGLNALGYNAGAVDGQIGDGTRAAFLQFRAETEGAPNINFAETTLTGWCLFIANQAGIDEATRAIAAPIQDETLIYIRIQVDAAALAKVALTGPENTTIAESDTFEIVGEGEGDSILVATFPYHAVKRANRICAMFADGYGVLDSKGNSYPGSCNRQAIEFWLGDRLMQYKTVRLAQ